MFWGTLFGAGHFEPTGSAGGFSGPSTAWLRYHLMDDELAMDEFIGPTCGLCQDSSWDVERKDL